MAISVPANVLSQVMVHDPFEDEDGNTMYQIQVGSGLPATIHKDEADQIARFILFGEQPDVGDPALA